MKTALAVSAVVGLLALSSCGSQQGESGGDSAADPTTDSSASTTGTSPSGSTPTEVPPPEGPVVGVGTVLDPQGDTGGPQLCVGPVAESAPPQCQGIPVEGWSWKAVGKTFESMGGARWGSYAVTGTYDGAAFTITEKPVSSALYDPANPAPDPLVTRCEEPPGGWSVVDPARTTYADQDAVTSAALQLPGYAGSFVDNTEVAGEGEASQTIVNVLVTEDVEGAEKALRPVWGGALCVTQAQNTEQELIAVQDGLTDLPGLLSSGTQVDQVVADVVWDDGSLQEWADATYGEGLVAISPALAPVG
jgi:hypothetical protein